MLLTIITDAIIAEQGSERFFSVRSSWLWTRRFQFDESNYIKSNVFVPIQGHLDIATTKAQNVFVRIQWMLRADVLISNKSKTISRYDTDKSKIERMPNAKHRTLRKNIRHYFVVCTKFQLNFGKVVQMGMNEAKQCTGVIKIECIFLRRYGLLQFAAKSLFLCLSAAATWRFHGFLCLNLHVYVFSGNHYRCCTQRLCIKNSCCTKHTCLSPKRIGVSHKHHSKDDEHFCLPSKCCVHLHKESGFRCRFNTITRSLGKT